ncbi:site-specific integrase [Salinicoccus roseus]|uniref:site-specific integrase n=1 Tax=Salinicoccus roseus TaxID=45670 RepID=UPI0023008248|nr:site-specific integrase [Salinicoccus roseus]
MPVYKDEYKNGWKVRLSYVDKFGKRHYHTKRGFSRRGDAKDYEESYHRSIERDELVDGFPFNRLAESYLEWYKKRHKPSSVKSVKNYLNNHHVPFFGSIDIHEITAQDIIDFHDHMFSKTNRNGEPLKKGYIQDIHTSLSSVLNHGVKFHGLKINAASIAGNIEDDEIKNWDYWTLEEFKTFYDSLEHIRDRAHFRLLFYAGLRNGEQRALTWNDINFSREYVSVNKTNYNGIVGTPKTKSSIRVVYIPHHVVEILEEYQEWYKQNQPYKDNYVVFGSFNSSYGETTIDNWKNNLIDRVDGLKRIKLHEFRHSHASDCINRLHMDRETLAKRLGHSSSITIEKYYGHLYPGTEKGAIQGL